MLSPLHSQFSTLWPCTCCPSALMLPSKHGPWPDTSPFPLPAQPCSSIPAAPPPPSPAQGHMALQQPSGVSGGLRGSSSSIWVGDALWMLLWTPKPRGKGSCRVLSCTPTQVVNGTDLMSVLQHLALFRWQIFNQAHGLVCYQWLHSSKRPSQTGIFSLLFCF